MDSQDDVRKSLVQEDFTGNKKPQHFIATRKMCTFNIVPKGTSHFLLCRAKGHFHKILQETTITFFVNNASGKKQKSGDIRYISFEGERVNKDLEYENEKVVVICSPYLLSVDENKTWEKEDFLPFFREIKKYEKLPDNPKLIKKKVNNVRSVTLNLISKLAKKASKTTEVVKIDENKENDIINDITNMIGLESSIPKGMDTPKIPNNPKPPEIIHNFFNSESNVKEVYEYVQNSNPILFNEMLKIDKKLIEMNVNIKLSKEKPFSFSDFSPILPFNLMVPTKCLRRSVFNPRDKEEVDQFHISEIRSTLRDPCEGELELRNRKVCFVTFDTNYGEIIEVLNNCKDSLQQVVKLICIINERGACALSGATFLEVKKEIISDPNYFEEYKKRKTSSMINFTEIVLVLAERNEEISTTCAIKQQKQSITIGFTLSGVLETIKRTIIGRNKAIMDNDTSSKYYFTIQEDFIKYLCKKIADLTNKRLIKYDAAQNFFKVCSIPDILFKQVISIIKNYNKQISYCNLSINSSMKFIDKISFALMLINDQDWESVQQNISVLVLLQNHLERLVMKEFKSEKKSPINHVKVTKEFLQVYSTFFKTVSLIKEVNKINDKQLNAKLSNGDYYSKLFQKIFGMVIQRKLVFLLTKNSDVRVVRKLKGKRVVENDVNFNQNISLFGKEKTDLENEKIHLPSGGNCSVFDLQEYNHIIEKSNADLLIIDPNMDLKDCSRHIKNLVNSGKTVILINLDLKEANQFLEFEKDKKFLKNIIEMHYCFNSSEKINFSKTCFLCSKNVSFQNGPFDCAKKFKNMNSLLGYIEVFISYDIVVFVNCFDIDFILNSFADFFICSSKKEETIDLLRSRILLSEKSENDLKKLIEDIGDDTRRSTIEMAKESVNKIQNVNVRNEFSKMINLKIRSLRASDDDDIILYDENKKDEEVGEVLEKRKINKISGEIDNNYPEKRRKSEK